MHCTIASRKTAAVPRILYPTEEPSNAHKQAVRHITRSTIRKFEFLTEAARFAVYRVGAGSELCDRRTLDVRGRRRSGMAGLHLEDVPDAAAG